MVALAKIAVKKQCPGMNDNSRTDDSAYVRLGLLALGVTFVFLLAWASLAPLRSAVVANGRLVAASQNKTVEHLDGGLIEEILAHDGDRVGSGQVLLRLDPRPLQIQLDNVDSQLFEIQANLQRLRAEHADRVELTFEAALAQQARNDVEREILATQQALFEARRQALAAERDMLTQRAKQATNQADGLGNVISHLRERVALLDQDLAGLRKLSTGKLVSDSKLREMQRRRGELTGEIAEREGDVAALRETVAENRQRIDLRYKEYRREVADNLRNLQAKLISLQAARRAIEEKLARIEIRAPAAGTIKGFDIATTGTVIDAGQPIMEIVPVESRYRIQARISPMDVDALHPGMQAEVRLAAIDGARHFPVIYADLQSVSADAYSDERRDSDYYKAVLEMRSEALQVLAAEQARLIPGMPVDLYIKTGERTLLDYLTRPIQDLFARALNEA